MPSISPPAPIRGRPDLELEPTGVSPWDRRDPTLQRVVLTATVCILVMLLPLGPNRFVLAAVILAVQASTTVVINRSTQEPVDRLGAFLIVEHSLGVIATLLVPGAYIGSNLITIGSLGANAAYLSQRWLRLLGVVTALNTVAAPLVLNVQDAPLIISLGLVLIVHTVVNRSGAVLVAESIAKGAQWQADHDALTGLPNRRVLRKRLGELETDAHTGLLLVDMNNFKEINDTLGHDFGDEVLRAVAARMSTIDESILVVRLGGDEFAAVVPGGSEATQRFADRLAEVWNEPVTVLGVEIIARGAIGMAHSDSVESKNLLRFADIAMYRAKNAGEASSWYQIEDDPYDDRRLRLVLEVPDALRSGGVRPWFQSQVDMASRDVVGVEALARWQHDEFGVVGADELLELVGLTGQQTQLTETMVVQSVAEAATWPGHIRLSVNVVGSDLANPRFVDIVLSTLERFGVDPHRLTVEIVGQELDLESTMTLEHLALLRDAGILISLDDFGRAHSSMYRLDRFEVDEVKIDGGLIASMGHRESSRAIVDSIAGLGHRLDVRVVAKGVESAEIAAAVSAAGIHLAQGFLYSRPSKTAMLVTASTASIDLTASS